MITGSQQGVYVDATSAVGAGSSQNCIEDNTTYGVNTANPAGAPFLTSRPAACDPAGS